MLSEARQAFLSRAAKVRKARLARMAVMVINGFQSIHIENCGPESLRVPPGRCHGTARMIVKGSVIIQAGQGNAGGAEN
jgi:hypothetical protein